MDTPAERAAPRADHGIDWDYVNAHHHPVTLIRRPAYEGWGLGLFGAVLVGLIGLLGWAGYALFTVQANLRQVHGQVRHLHAHIAQLDPLSAGREPLPAETAQRLQALDQRLALYPASCWSAFASAPRARICAVKPQSAHNSGTSSSSSPWSKPIPCRCSRVGSGRATGMLALGA